MIHPNPPRRHTRPAPVPRIDRWLLLVLGLGLVLGCSTERPDSPEVPQSSDALVVSLDSTQVSTLGALGAVAGCSRWIWNSGHPPLDRSGTAILEVGNGTGLWRFEIGAAPDTSGRLNLAPVDPRHWHSLAVRRDTTDESCWLPLPRIPVRTPYYADLLDLVHSLTGPLHGGRVRRWALDPIPVTPSSAMGDAVDFGALWSDAVAIWNEGFDQPVFTWETAFAEGVRLVFRPRETLRPPMWARLLRLDADQRPLLIHVVSGANFDRPTAIRSARRAFVHELAHALQLWGHSLDPDHVLWRWGPVVDEPAPEERMAILWWRTLPEGLDLERYGRSAELDPYRVQGQGTSVEHGSDGPETAHDGHGFHHRGRNGDPLLIEAPHHDAFEQ